MESVMKDCRDFCKRIGLLSLFLSLGVASAQTPGVVNADRVRGQIVTLQGTNLQLKSDGGETLAIKLTDSYRLSGVAKADLSKITPNAYIAVTSLPQPDGSLNAVEIRIFPESMRGTGEGHRPMDNKAGTTMTNATVSDVNTRSADTRPAGEMVTNATVSQVNGAATRHVTVKYSTGEKLVNILPTTPIFTIEPAEKTMLVPGAHIVVNLRKQPDGAVVGDRVTLGLNGAVPTL
jgi:hypothetical protein